MGQKFQREYLKRADQLTSEELRATGISYQDKSLVKIYIIEDVDTGQRQIRGSVVAEEELKKQR